MTNTAPGDSTSHKTVGALVLTAVLLGGIMVTMIWHSWAVTQLFMQFLDTPPSPSIGGDQTTAQHFEIAYAYIRDTAKTLYAILTPLFVAVGGFYFWQLRYPKD